MHRREFLTRAAALGGAAMLGPKLLGACTGGDGDGGGTARFSSILEQPATEAPVDTVVVVMMENRSFDHYLGWLADDERFLEAGRSRYGADFRVDGAQQQRYADPEGVEHDTVHWLALDEQTDPWRGCGFLDPGHQWGQGRAQRDDGFLAAGSGNDAFALGYYLSEDLPFHTRMAERFTTFDHWYCSLLAPTFPNREYLHSAQSGGNMANAFPADIAIGFDWETIWDRLTAAGVPARYYFSDLPVTYLFGTDRMEPITSPLEDYFDDAASGRLPDVVFVDPAFTEPGRNDDHPHADIRAGQRFLHDVFAAFVESPHWERGAFVVTYDEWGGFFDHVTPPVFPDDRASDVDQENFGQSGFRVPSFVASPRARPGYVEHTAVDHTSVLRFLEWRFLGAPATGPGDDGDAWFLTARDRHAFNLGALLGLEDPEMEVDLDLTIDQPSPLCPEDTEDGGEANGEEPVAQPALARVPARGESVWDEMVARGYLDLADDRRRARTVLV